MVLKRPPLDGQRYRYDTNIDRQIDRKIDRYRYIWGLLSGWWLSGKKKKKKPTCSAGAAGDMYSIRGWRISPGGGYGNPLQYSCLENPMDRGAWWATVHGGHKELDMTEETQHVCMHTHTHIYKHTHSFQK